MPISLTDKSMKTLLLISTDFGSTQIGIKGSERLEGLNSVFSRPRESSKVVRVEHPIVATGERTCFL